MSLYKVVFCFLGIICGIPVASAQKNAAMNQRRINEYAATIDHAVSSLIAIPGARRKDEPLPSYFSRLVTLQPKEIPANYQRRMFGLLSLISQLGRIITPLHKSPQLQDVSPTNKQQWQEIAQNSTVVTQKGDKILSIWQAYLKNAANPTLQAQQRQEIGKEMLTTVYYAIKVRKALGVAHP